MNLKAIFYFLGLFCFPISILSFINILYSLYFDHFLNVESYFATLLTSLILGFTLIFFSTKSPKKINFFEQLILILLSYLLIACLISIPYYLSNYQISLINALFESFSGLTTTGFSIFENIKYLDPTLILWRSSSQWIGGLYFLYFLILIFSNKQFTFKLNNLTYTSDGNIINSNNIKNLLLKIFLIYSSLSLIIFFFLNISEIRLFNALNLMMTIISTGGFLPTDSLENIFSYDGQKAILILCFLIPTFNLFFLINLTSKKKIITEHKEDLSLFFSFIVFGLIALIPLNKLNIYDIFFSVISSLSNSGLSLSKMPQNITLYFIFITLVGGSLISNTSGIKLMRFYILLKTVSSEIIRLVRPNEIINQSIFNSNKKISSENIKFSFLIFISFFISLFILSSLLILDTINFETSFKLSILALTNTVNSNLYGLENIDFSNLLTSSKISLIIFMIIGKIELISIFLIIKKIFIKN